MAHMTLKGVIDRDAGAAARLTVVRRQAGSLLDRRARYLTSPGLDDDMRTGYAARVQPEIVAGGMVKGDVFVLAAVLADENGKAFFALLVKRYAAARPGSFAALALLAFRFGSGLRLQRPAAHVPRALHFGLDQLYLGGILGEIKVGQKLLDRSEFRVVLFDLRGNQGQGAAQLVIFVEEAVGVPYGVEARIERYPDGGRLTLPGIVVFQFGALLPLGNLVLVREQ